jgi:hypothetical protein
VLSQVDPAATVVRETLITLDDAVLGVQQSAK